MSDNDFFFEDDTKAEPAPKAKPASASVKKPAPSGAVTKKPAPKSSARPAVPARGEMVEQQSVTITIAVLIAVVALLIGVIIGIFIGRAMVPEAVVNPVTPTGTPMGSGTGTAPVLTEEQIEQGMPAGHPDPAASTETTSAQ